MALNTKMAEDAVNIEADALGTRLNSGFLRIYDGVQPTTADDAIVGQILLAELTLGNPAFAAATGGVIIANAITSDNDANQTGIASWFRIVRSDGITKGFDGSAGVGAGFNLNLNSTAIQQHAQVSVTGFTHTIPKS